MIRQETMLNIADNSGAKKIQCIRILGGTKKKSATIGDIIIASVKKADPKSQIKKKDIVRAVIVRTAKEKRRKEGDYIRFDDNAAVIVEKNNEPKSTRIGIVAREVRAVSPKIASLAKETC